MSANRRINSVPPQCTGARGSCSRGTLSKVLRNAAQTYKVDVDAHSVTFKQEFAAKEKGTAAKKAAPKPPARQQPKTVKKSDPLTGGKEYLNREITCKHCVPH
jgi:hypothetical protein